MVTGFRQGLKEAGYVDGQNVVIEFRWADGHYDQLSAMASDLVRRQVAVIATGGSPAALAAKAATSALPIIFVVGIDAVQLGLVGSLNRPSGNVTGLVVRTVELAAKKLEVLHEMLPTAAAIAVLVNPTTPITGPEMKAAQDASRSIGLADDAVLCFQYREDAEKVMNVLPKRFARYGLTLHPEKTRLVAFGRQALAEASRTGLDRSLSHTASAV
jgi:putative ABC transport system substrate-binding protein